MKPDLYFFKLSIVGFVGLLLSLSNAAYSQCPFSPSINSSSGSFSFCQGSSIALNASPSLNASFVWKRQGVILAGQTSSSITVNDAASYRVLVTVAGCTDSVSVNTAINPPPTVSLSIPNNLKSLCSNSGSFSLTGFENPLGGTWFINGTPNFPTIFPALGAATYAIEYRYTDIQGCTNAAFDTVRVLAQPVISLSAIPAVCENEDPVSLNPYGTPTGGTWSGLGVIGANQFDPATSGLINLTYTYMDPISSCSASQSTQVLVNASPNVSFNPFILPDQCEGDLPNVLSGFVSPTPGSSLFNSSFRGNGIVNANTGLFDPNLASIGTRDTLWYTAQNTVTSCSDSAFSLIRVNVKPSVSFVLNDSIVCNTDPIFTLTGGNPAGGSYIGKPGNVVSGRYNPSFAGAGTDTIYYLFFDFNSCSDIVSHIIEVKPPPSIVFSPLPVLCENDTAIVLNQASPKGGQYTGNGVFGDTLFSPNLPGVAIGLNQIRYTYTDSFGCSGTLSENIQISPKPSVNFNMAPNLCTNQELIDLNLNDEIFVEPLGGSFIGDSVLNDTLYLRGFASDSVYRISYFYTDGAGCSDTASSFFQMHEPPSFNFETRGVSCIDVPVSIKVVEELRYEWSTGENGQEIRPIIDSDSTFFVTVSDFFCSNNDSVNIVLIPPSNLKAFDDSLSTSLDTPFEFNPLENDSGRLGAINVFEGPFNGSVVLDSSRIDYSPDLDFRRIDTIRYEVCDEICDNICDTAIIKINVLGDPYSFIPNAFTPDGDGMNETFVVPGLEAYPDNTLKVFNIQGEVVFQAEPYANDWDGTLNGVSLPGIKGKVPDGTYFYILSLGSDQLTGELDIRTR